MLHKTSNIAKVIYILSFIRHSVILKHITRGSTELTKEWLNPKIHPKALSNLTLLLLKVLVVPPGRDRIQPIRRKTT